MNRAAIIFNRAPVAQEGWIHIVPKGTLPNTDARVAQVLDDVALDSILANIQKDKNRMGDNWPGIYAGREHFIYDAGQDSAALGWFKDFEKRGDGIYAKADGLTPAGEQAVNNGEYKYTSFVADPSDLQKIPGTQDGLPLYRVTAIDTIGFTNHANGKDLLTPITNRENFGSHGSKAAQQAAADENRRHVQANKDAAAQADAQRQADAEGEAAEFALPALEKFCRAVDSVIKSAVTKNGRWLSPQAAWTYAKQQFPALYAAAFATGADTDAGAGNENDAAVAGKQATMIANRVGKLAGRNFEYGWNFVARELPMLFNRMSAPPGHVMNRQARPTSKYAIANAAKVFNRLVQAEMIFKSLHPTAAYIAVHKAHPGLSGLAHGRLLASEALGEEPALSELLA